MNCIQMNAPTSFILDGWNQGHWGWFKLDNLEIKILLWNDLFLWRRFRSLCWWPIWDVGGKNILNRSSSWIGQHPESVTNINVTDRFEWLQKLFYDQPLVIANDKTWKFRWFNLINSFVVDVTGFFSRCLDIAFKCKISRNVNTFTWN